MNAQSNPDIRIEQKFSRVPLRVPRSSSGVDFRGEDKESGKGETHVRFTGTEERISRVVRGSSDSEIPGAGLTNEMGQTRCT